MRNRALLGGFLVSLVGCILPPDDDPEFRGGSDYTISRGDTVFWGVRTAGGIRDGGLDGPKLIAYTDKGIQSPTGRLLCAIDSKGLHAGPSRDGEVLFEAEHGQVYRGSVDDDDARDDDDDDDDDDARDARGDRDDDDDDDDDDARDDDDGGGGELYFELVGSTFVDGATGNVIATANRNLEDLHDDELMVIAALFDGVCGGNGLR